MVHFHFADNAACYKSYLVIKRQRAHSQQGQLMSRTISKVAKEIGINIETVRFYERKGLIKQPAKPLQGYRQYPTETVDRIRFIKRSQELGFTLKEIEGLLALSDAPCRQVEELAQKKLIAVQKKQNDLLRLEKALLELLSQCQNNKDNTHCPIIESLQPNL